jgi:hypothetical protein
LRFACPRELNPAHGRIMRAQELTAGQTDAVMTKLVMNFPPGME